MSIGQLDKNRLVLFGISDDLKNFIWDTKREIILGITDLNEELYGKSFKYSTFGETIFSGIVSSVEEVCKMSFDYIIVTNYDVLEQVEDKIHTLLRDKGIKEERVVMYDYYAQCIRAHTFYSVQEENIFLSLLKNTNSNDVIDMDLFFIDKYRFSREYDNMTFPANVQVDAWSSGNEIRPIYNNVYRRIYNDFKDIELKTYDTAIFSDYRTFQGYMTAFDFAKNIANNIVFRFRTNSVEYHKFSTMDFSAWGTMRYLNFEGSCFIMLSKSFNDEMKIYIVTHKQCKIPKDIVRVGGGYTVIQAGRKINPHIEKCIGDDTGDSISELNPFINELTALYWIWKNTSHEYVGLIHYRRYFLSKFCTRDTKEIPILNEQQVREILKEYDIILRFKFYERSDAVKRNQFFWIIGVDLFKKSYDIIRKWLLIRQPTYVSHLDFVLGSSGFFPSNMFVTRKKVIDKYCEWLFSFLFDALKEFDMNVLEGNKLRIMGYWGELLFTVWIVVQNLKIKQLPCWMPPS